VSRKPAPASAIVEVKVNEERIAADMVAVNELAAHSAAISKQFGDGLPYDRERTVNEARFYMAQSAEAMLEAGKRLVLIKENEPHGEFTRIVEERIGIEERVARRMMQASVKFLGADLAGAKRSALSVLGKTKLYELMVLDDEDLDELAEGGTVVGLVKDDIDRMTSRELRKKLRETEANYESQGELIAAKDSKINELELTLRGGSAKGKKNTAARERADLEAQLIKSLQDKALVMLGTINEIETAVADIEANEPSEAMNTAVEQTITWLFQSIADIANKRFLPVDFEAVVKGEFFERMRPGAADSDTAAAGA